MGGYARVHSRGLLQFRFLLREGEEEEGVISEILTLTGCTGFLISTVKKKLLLYTRTKRNRYTHAVDSLVLRRLRFGFSGYR